MALLRAVVTVGGFTMASRVLGFVRDVLVAALLGAEAGADAFFVALRLPNFFRALFAEGAFSAAFVPLYAGLLESEGRRRALAFASEVLAVLLAALLALTFAVEAAMPWVMTVLAPGFVGDPVRFDLAVDLTRVTFPYLTLLSLVALLGATLNAAGHFAAFAAAPILLNACMIAAALLAGPLGMPVPATLAWGVAAAGIAQFLLLATVAARHDCLPRLSWPRLTPDVRRLSRLILPVALGAGITQVNLFVGVIIATFLPTGAVSFLYYADRLYQLPLGVVGIAIGTALLPLLARQIRAGNVDAAMANQNRAIEAALLLTVPAALALALLADPIVAVLFQRGAFDVAAARATAAALVAFVGGLPAAVLARALTPGFFARQDTATPVRIALASMVVYVAVATGLAFVLGHVGIAVATSAAAWLNAVLLARALGLRGHLVVDARLRRRAPRLVAASGVMGVVVALARPLAERWIVEGGVQAWLALGALVALGLGTFALAAQALGAAALADLRGLRRGPRLDRGANDGP
ncbi:MAG: murein biosynthesis integral membrane protein MurJ [Alphaproteobacteria bacterium]|nr:murein biosynthesis integral membrane protein MurJ [Alphaproteobacteria bacterium]